MRLEDASRAQLLAELKRRDDAPPVRVMRTLLDVMNDSHGDSSTNKARAVYIPLQGENIELDWRDGRLVFEFEHVGRAPGDAPRIRPLEENGKIAAGLLKVTTTADGPAAWSEPAKRPKPCAPKVW